MRLRILGALGAPGLQDIVGFAHVVVALKGPAKRILSCLINSDSA